VITRRILLLSVIVTYIGQAQAQYTEYRYKRKNHSTEEGYQNASQRSRYLSGGVGLNLHAYHGELTPHENYILNQLKTVRPGMSAFAMYNFNPVVFFTGEFSYGRITGDDFNADPNSSARKYVRNLHFRNDLIGLSLRANANLFRDPFEYYKRRDFNIYFFSGMTFFYSNPKAKVPVAGKNGETFENADEWVALRPLGTEGQNSAEYGEKYSAIQLGIPFGGGLRFRLGYRLDLMIEGSFHYILSDYIDDIGSNYVDLGVFDNELAKALSDRSMEEIAALKGEQRDKQVIEASTTEYTYESRFDGNTYTVYKNFGHDGAVRGGGRNDIVGTFSMKISYIFTH
jgi:hypothetical protein